MREDDPPDSRPPTPTNGVHDNGGEFLRRQRDIHEDLPLDAKITETASIPRNFEGGTADPARLLIYKRMVLGVDSAGRGSLWESMSIRVYLDFRFGNPKKALQLYRLRALETVHTLTIASLDLRQILPIFDRCFSQFVLTLRPPLPDMTHCKNTCQLRELICRFTHLDDLELLNPRSPRPSLLGGSSKLCQCQEDRNLHNLTVWRFCATFEGSKLVVLSRTKEAVNFYKGTHEYTRTRNKYKSRR